MAGDMDMLKIKAERGVLSFMQIVLNQTYNTYDSEAAFKNCTEFQSVFSSYANSWTPPAKLMYQGNDTLVVPGTYTHSTHILDLVINETGGPAGEGGLMIAMMNDISSVIFESD